MTASWFQRWFSGFSLATMHATLPLGGRTFLEAWTYEKLSAKMSRLSCNGQGRISAVIHQPKAEAAAANLALPDDVSPQAIRRMMKAAGTYVPADLTLKKSSN